ncbi:Hypothetical_protein [Hexamita inflata]|uniref:Hypothetical_protein n=1 Tax=Hexamita inflata TaxID=28002 RepID=A0AA86U1E7_9EUKA|nr:Hypothetical protein HINF_LOCUS24284 [Hexamita inflata]
MRGGRSTVCRRPCASPRYERRVQTHGRAANHSALGRLIPKQREGPGYSLWRTPDKRSLLRAAFECNTSTCAAGTARRSSALQAAAAGVVRLELGGTCQPTHTAAKRSATAACQKVGHAAPLACGLANFQLKVKQIRVPSCRVGQMSQFAAAIGCTGCELHNCPTEYFQYFFSKLILFLIGGNLRKQGVWRASPCLQRRAIWAGQRRRRSSACSPSSLQTVVRISRAIFENLTRTAASLNGACTNYGPRLNHTPRRLSWRWHLRRPNQIGTNLRAEQPKWVRFLGQLRRQQHGHCGRLVCQTHCATHTGPGTDAVYGSLTPRTADAGRSAAVRVMMGGRSTVCRRPCALPLFERRFQIHGRAANHSALGQLIPKQREGPGCFLRRTPGKGLCFAPHLSVTPRRVLQRQPGDPARFRPRPPESFVQNSVVFASQLTPPRRAVQCQGCVPESGSRRAPRLWSGQLPAKSETNSCSQLQSGPNALIRSCNRTHRV